MKAVILAAGKGTRMGSLTDELPKPMLPVEGRPILEHIISGIAAQGVREFHLITGWKAEVIEQFDGKVSEDAVTRFKGLGEMSPHQLKETAMLPESRTLQRVFIDDPLETERVVSDLMGKDASARYKFVMEKAEEADDVDH